MEVFVYFDRNLLQRITNQKNCIRRHSMLIRLGGEKWFCSGSLQLLFCAQIIAV